MLHERTGADDQEATQRDEAAALRPLSGTPPFLSARDLLRRVGADCAIEVDGNAYSVPWRLIGERVRVTVSGGAVRVLHAGREVALHTELKGRRGRAVNDCHLAGIVGSPERPIVRRTVAETELAETPALLRPLAEYEALAGGHF